MSVSPIGPVRQAVYTRIKNYSSWIWPLYSKIPSGSTPPYAEITTIIADRSTKDGVGAKKQQGFDVAIRINVWTNSGGSYVDIDAISGVIMSAITDERDEVFNPLSVSGFTTIMQKLDAIDNIPIEGDEYEHNAIDISLSLQS